MWDPLSELFMWGPVDTSVISGRVNECVEYPYLSVLNYLRFTRDLFRVTHICIIQYQYVSAKEECENFARPLKNYT
jgi:hypothetical protein